MKYTQFLKSIHLYYRPRHVGANEQTYNSAA